MGGLTEIQTDLTACRSRTSPPRCSGRRAGCPDYPRLRVLDLSAGRGEIAAALARDGCAVRGTHFRADDYKLGAEPGPIAGSRPDAAREYRSTRTST